MQRSLVGSEMCIRDSLAIGRRYHPLARIAKDCAAAAVLTAAISSMLIALFLLLPPLLLRLGL